MLQTPLPQGAAAYRRNLTPRQMEAQLFSMVARRLREPGTPTQQARGRADARRLWSCVLDLVTDPSNQLPTALRGQMASLALAVQRECDASEPDHDFLAAVTEDIAQGLWA